MAKEQLLARIENDFTYHRPPAERQQDFVDIRMGAKLLAKLMIDKCPEGRELSSALTKLEEAVMHANAGIARLYPADAVKAA
jgi:hypothetical protein